MTYSARIAIHPVVFGPRPLIPIYNPRSKCRALIAVSRILRHAAAQKAACRW